MKYFSVYLLKCPGTLGLECSLGTEIIKYFFVRLNKVFMTGKAVFVKDDGSVNIIGSYVGGSVMILMFIIFIFMMSKRGSKKTEGEVMSDDDKELKYMEKRVKETEAKLSKIKNKREKRAKIESVKES